MASSKMCCVFCKAMGKAEGEWNNHWVKDKPGPDGKVVCPALLSNECGYCHAIGHTPKFCPKLAAKKERQAKRKAAGGGSRQLGAWIKPKMTARRGRVGASPVKLVASNRYSAFTATVPVTKPAAKVVKGPSPVVPMPPQGAWNAAHKAEVATLKAELEAMKLKLAAREQTAALKEYLTKESVIDFVGEQTLEETAAGEAFFDNVLDTEEAVTGIAAAEQPTLIRQGAFGGGGDGDSAPLPKPKLCRESTTAAKADFLAGKMTAEEAIASNGLGVAGNPPAIALPDNCNLDEDFGEGCDDGWGSC